MSSDYKPPKDASDVFARYKSVYEEERDLKPEMREMAKRELKAGATVSQLAKLTGLTPEVFRRMARDLGVERRRDPTVGKLKPQTAAPAGNPPQADPERWEGPRSGRKRPPRGWRGTPLAIRNLADLARTRADSVQLAHLEHAANAQPDEDKKPHAVLREAYDMGLLTDADLYAEQPDTTEET